MELGAGHHSGAKNFQVAVRFLKKLDPRVKIVLFCAVLFERWEIYLNRPKINWNSFGKPNQRSWNERLLITAPTGNGALQRSVQASWLLGYSFVRLFEIRRMRWVGLVGRMEDGRGACRVLVGRPKGKRPFGRLRHNGRIMLKWIFKMWDGKARSELLLLRIGTDGRCLWMR